MPETGFRTALDIARELNGPQDEQPDLFSAPDAGQNPPPAKRSPGRPKGAHNLSTKRFAQWLMSHAGDPLLPAMRVANLDILDEETVLELARRWRCEPLEAVKEWRAINQGVQDFVHQRQPRALTFSPGDPDRDEDEDDYRELPKLKPLPGDDAKDVTPANGRVIDHE